MPSQFGWMGNSERSGAFVRFFENEAESSDPALTDGQKSEQSREIMGDLPIFCLTQTTDLIEEAPVS